MPRSRPTGQRASPAFFILAGFLVAVFLFGGGARSDIQSLLLLRPLAVLVCAAALWTLRPEHVRQHRAMFGLLAAAAGLLLLHLLPLPPAIWTSLPGREIVVAIDRVAGLGEVWRPISLAPATTWNALFSLLVPLAVLLLGVQLDHQDRLKLLPLIIAFGLVSGLVGLVQAIGPANGPLYLYSVTNNGTAVGLFSNRNHHAHMLAMLFPMLAVFASREADSEDHVRLRGIAAASIALLTVPLLLVTGSRAGLGLGAVGLLAAALLWRKPQITADRVRRGGRRVDLRKALVVLAVLTIGGVTMLSTRSESTERLLAPDRIDEIRFKTWGSIAESGWRYFPVGSGIGSFTEAHRMDEPDRILRPTYLNHAHNDWLELFLTGGLPALLILAAALAWLGTATYRAFATPPDPRGRVALARLGAVLVVMLLLGSVVDYPTRTPSLVAVLVIAGLWLHRSQETGRNNPGAIHREGGQAARSSAGRGPSIGSSVKSP